MTPIHILLVEDEEDQRGLVAGILRHLGHGVEEAASAERALEKLSVSSYDMVVSDWKLPGKDGLQILHKVRAEHPATAFIMVTAYGSISKAVEAVRLGADDYLAKPYQREALLLAITRAHQSRRLMDENRRLLEELNERDRLVDLIGSSACMQRLFRRVEKVAGTDVTVLLTGESGTGKELAARALHTLSPRNGRPFVAVNCAAIPEGLLEAEFFGAERGAYTGADRSRPGKFEAADRGTLFLDEVGELPATIQPKLLRAIQDGVVCRIGGNRETRVDIRLVAATNRDLQADVVAGRFREDLFYRLNVVPVALPPLRERREDIPRLAKYFQDRTCKRHKLHFAGLPPRVLKRLIDFSWPGNVRELANVVERLILLSEDGHILEEDLPREVSAPARADSAFRLPAGGMSWEKHELDCLRQALELAAGNRARAARLLDLSYKAFLYRMEKHGIA